ncbi:metal ABC transporter ATP-binding protein [Macrococcus capreoli]|uniref:metal ABC transporter ATP-binding protein n=1 Tax=Macrococcus capreoli TaxID=2982690 RepID=UPI003EE7784B
MFQINDLSVHINDQTILSHIHYTQQSSGKIIGILGPNGAGKSTLFKAILGFIPHTGDTYWNNKLLKNNTNLCSYVPQKSTVDLTFPITVEHVILSGLYNGKLNTFNQNGMYKVNELLIQFELTHCRHKTLNTLSGGQLQRVLLARSLMQDKMIYFLDEPFVGIDFKSYDIIKKCIFELKNKDKLIFIIHHDLNSATSLFDDIIMLNKQVVATGPTETTLTQDNLEKTFFNTGGLQYV